MGLFEQIKALRIGPEKYEFKNDDDVTGHRLIVRAPGEDLSDDEFEIERDALLNILHGLLKDDVEFIFNNTIADLVENENHIEAVFKDGSKNQYDFIFGCDGIHSAVRKLWFGEEREFVHFLGQYFSIAVIDKLLVPNGTYQMYSEPDKGASLYAHSNKTDVIFIFRTEKEIEYDFQNQQKIKEIVSLQMDGMKWRIKELKQELMNSDSFYFDKFCQVKMTSWTKERVALVGDAGYCASPAAGMGGSLAIIGATALADSFEKYPNNYKAAFEYYNTGLKPFIEEVQAAAVETLNKLLPNTEEQVKTMWKNGIEF